MAWGFLDEEVLGRADAGISIDVRLLDFCLQSIDESFRMGRCRSYFDGVNPREDEDLDSHQRFPPRSPLVHKSPRL